MGKEELRKECIMGRVSHLVMHNSDMLIHIGPCLLTGVTVSGDGASGSCELYDGLDAAGDHKIHLEVLTGVSFGIKMMYPADFDKGLYLAVGESTTYVMVQYIPESWHDFW